MYITGWLYKSLNESVPRFILWSKSSQKAIFFHTHDLSGWHHVWVATRRLQDWGPLYVRNAMVYNLWGWDTVVLKMYHQLSIGQLQ